MPTQTKQQQIAEVVERIREYQSRLDFWTERYRKAANAKAGAGDQERMQLCRNILSRSAIELADILEDKA
jgi:hypothetical protein